MAYSAFKGVFSLFSPSLFRIDFPSVRGELSNRVSVKASVCVACYRPVNAGEAMELM